MAAACHSGHGLRISGIRSPGRRPTMAGMSTTDTSNLPDYAPVPRSALGPALNEQGYYVGRVERNLYWITDGTYQSAFLTTSEGVVLIDIVNPGWAPVYVANLTEDIPGYIEAPANALAYAWKHFIGGHLGRLGTRDDVTLHQRYMADISESSRNAVDTVDPTPYFMKYGENTWAALKGYLDEVTRVAAAPVIEKYTGVLAAADVYTESTTFWVMESIRLDLGYGSQVHP